MSYQPQWHQQLSGMTSAVQDSTDLQSVLLTIKLLCLERSVLRKMLLRQSVYVFKDNSLNCGAKSQA